MTTSQPDRALSVSEKNPALLRRGLLAAAWAAVAGLMLKFTTEPVQAAASLQFGNVASSSATTNAALAPTTLVAMTGYPTTDAVFTGQAFEGSSWCGLQGVSGSRPAPPMRCGVYGNQDFLGSFGAGVLGDDRSSSGAGVLGRSGFNSNGNSVGVQGESTGGIGVRGLIPATSTANAISIYGLNLSSFAGPGPGAGGFGVYGLSAKGHGLVGATAAAGAAAVVGATNGVAGAYAAALYGPVIVGGNFTVVGGAKSAAVPHPDGSHRRLYCMESPESWFEDFGRGQLERGCAMVTIDPDFAAVANTDDYYVFLTPCGRAEMLAVTDQTPRGFRVETQNVTSNIPFSWRLVAKRKDITGARFEPVTIPPEPTLPPVPDVPIGR